MESVFYLLFPIASLKPHVTQDHVPLSKKLDQILKWIDLPLAKRPQLIMGTLLSRAYNPH